MRIHTDTLTYSDVYDSLAAAIGADKVACSVVLETLSEHGSRSRKRAFEFALEASEKQKGDGRRPRNSGNRGARSGQFAATWSEHGWFFFHLFLRDPNAIVGSYNGVEAFNAETFSVFTTEFLADSQDSRLLADKRRREQFAEACPHSNLVNH